MKDTSFDHNTKFINSENYRRKKDYGLSGFRDQFKK